MMVSILIPAYSEQNTLEEIIGRVRKINLGPDNFEIIIVNDCSTDGSKGIAESIASSDPDIVCISHNVNKGKRAAIRTALKRCSGDIIVIQDADLEYDPQDIPLLTRLLRKDIADVVIGSRFLSSGLHRVLYSWHQIGNQFLTI